MEDTHNPPSPLESSYFQPLRIGSMPKFIDAHPMGSIIDEQLKQLQNAPKDKFGVTHHEFSTTRRQGILRPRRA